MRGQRFLEAATMMRHPPIVSDNPEWNEVLPEYPCPACGAGSGCKIRADGEFLTCLREVGERPVVTGGWLHRLSPEGRVLVPA